MRQHALGAGWSAAEIARATSRPDGRLPRIDFVAEVEDCPDCGAAMRVGKSTERTLATAALGPFRAREMLKHCPRCASAPLFGCVALRRLVKPRQHFGYDLIVHVGLARYLRRMQRDEIRGELLRDLGIEVSSGTISALCDRFLSYLESLHLLRSPYLRAAMAGGYPMHLDATCDRGKGGLLVCLDGWRGWVLMAARIDSENPVQMAPVVDKAVALFGDPVATVRDLGEGGAHAVERLRKRGIPDLICHYHFLAAVGGKLFDQPYSCLRSTLRTSRVRTDLRALVRALRAYRNDSSHAGRFGSGPVRGDLLALMHWLLEADSSKDAPYPFSLPHFEFIRRCQRALERADEWVPCPRSEPERRAVRHLESLVGRLARDERIRSATAKIEQDWSAFCELRDVLRITNAELPRADERCGRQQPLPAAEHERLREIKNAVEEYRKRLSASAVKGSKSSPGSAEAVFLKYFDRYGHLLFGHPTLRDETGAIVAVVPRTNNAIEHFFGREKQRLRRRLGRANLGRDLEQQPAQAALAANLRHADYVRVLCGSIENLPVAFAALDAQAGRDTAPLIRSHRDSAVEKRVRVLLAANQQPANPTAHAGTPCNSATTVV